MRPFIQKLPLGERDSFVARTYRTPNFEVGWHQHVEFELILFTEGSGMSFIGSHIGDFKPGDIYFIGSNLPHTFQKRSPDLVTSAIVVQFREELWGAHFLDLPEVQAVRVLFQRASFGIKVNRDAGNILYPLVSALETSVGFRRLILLEQCLDILSGMQSAELLSEKILPQSSQSRRAVIDRVFQYTLDNFREPLTLEDAAKIACLSVSAFCAFFKRSTQKRYIDFLNEVRTGYAANLLTDTDMPIVTIAYESGYQTQSNFHKQFSRIKHCSPMQYRIAFREKRERPVMESLDQIPPSSTGS